MAIDIFLKIDGIPGESADEKHVDTIEIESFSWGLGASAEDKSKLAVQDFQFTSRVSKASPILMLSCATGKHIDTAVLTVRRTGEKQFEFLVIKLSDLLISSYQTGGSAGDIVPTDSFSLNFQRIENEYKEQKADGSAGATVRAGFDLKEIKT